jgi:hypothetical protein
VISAFGEANPFRTGSSSDLLSLLPFAVLIVVLYLTGREKLLTPKRDGSRSGDDKESGDLVLLCY